MAQFSFTEAKLRALRCDKTRWFSDARQSSLQVAVTPKGTRTFYFYAKVRGKPRREKLGRFPSLSLEDARKLARDRLTKRDRGELSDRKLVTFAEAFEAWTRDGRKRGKKSCDEDRKYFERDFGSFRDRPLKSLTKMELEELHEKWAESGPYKANRALGIIRAVFNFAEVDDGLSWQGPNPARRIRHYPEPRRERVLTADETDRFFAAMRDCRPFHQDFFMLLVLTASRQGVLREMRWEQIDWGLKTWTIPVTKNGKPLVIPLVGEAMEILDRRRAAVPEFNPWVFPSPFKVGNPIGDVYNAWNALCERAGIADYHMHDTRALIGTTLARNGVSLSVIGRALGHSPGSRATSVYLRHQHDDVREVLESAVTHLRRAK